MSQSRFDASGGTKQDFNAYKVDLLTKGNGARTRVIAGVIRNLDDGNGFQLITTGGHTPINIESIETMSDRVRVNYSFVGITVGTFVAVPDEALAKKGFLMGSSVANTYADIFFKKIDDVAGYITKSGGATPVFTPSATYARGIINIAWAGSTLTITHDKCYNPAGVSVQTRDNMTRAIVGSMDGTGNISYVKFFAGADTVASTPPDGTVLIFNRFGSGEVPPADIIYPSSNIWLYGVMNV